MFEIIWVIIEVDVLSSITFVEQKNMSKNYDAIAINVRNGLFK